MRHESPPRLLSSTGGHAAAIFPSDKNSLLFRNGRDLSNLLVSCSCLYAVVVVRATR
ncbi:unnamed protein product, partial [Ectocarpus sp. 13 AM-2016]